MTYDTVWCVSWHPSGQYDLRCHEIFFITQPLDNTSITDMPLCSAVYVQKGYAVNELVDIWY